MQTGQTTAICHDREMEPPDPEAVHLQMSVAWIGKQGRGAAISWPSFRGFPEQSGQPLVGSRKLD